TTLASVVYLLPLLDALPILSYTRPGAPRSCRVGPAASTGRLVSRGPIYHNATFPKTEVTPCDAGLSSLHCPWRRPLFRCWPRRSDRKSTRLNSSHVKISYAV